MKKSETEQQIANSSRPAFPLAHKAPHWNMLNKRKIMTGKISIFVGEECTDDRIGLSEFLCQCDTWWIVVTWAFNTRCNGKCNKDVKGEMLNSLDQAPQLGLPKSVILGSEHVITSSLKWKVRRMIKTSESIVNNEGTNLRQDDFSNDDIDIAKIICCDNDTTYTSAKTN